MHPGDTYTKEKVGTRYVHPIIRALANPEDSEDMKAAHAAQDAIKVEQASTGKSVDFYGIVADFRAGKRAVPGA